MHIRPRWLPATLILAAAALSVAAVSAPAQAAPGSTSGSASGSTSAPAAGAPGRVKPHSDAGTVPVTRVARPAARPALATSALDPDPVCATNQLAANDDGSTAQVALPFPVDFFGNTHHALYVNNNGNVTFDAPLATYTPFGLTTNISTPIIAAFFADIDTRGVGSDLVTYGSSAHKFCVNWGGTNGVGYFAGHADKLVKAQLELIDRSGDPGGAPGDFDIVMNYGGIGWESGDYSGGSAGLGGQSARVGYSAGTGAANTFYEFPGAGVPGSLLDSGPQALIESSRNSTQDGRYVFGVRRGSVPVGSDVGGTVYAGSNAAGNELADAFVQVCPTPAGNRGCNTSSTDEDGEYSVGGLPNGAYTVTAYPPAGSNARPGSITITTTGADLTGQDVVLPAPAPLPNGTTVTDLYTNDDGLPVIYWETPTTITTHGCSGGTATYTVTQDGASVSAGALTEGADGVFTGVVPPFYPVHGYVHFAIHLTCPDGPDEDFGFDAYIDPSGTVVDQADHPVVGAEVTLLRSDDVSGPFTPVPEGSALMSPANRVNPMTTGETGHFGWDVVAGYYEVRAQRDGCVSGADPALAYAQSAVLTVPPPVTGLKLALNCTNRAPVAGSPTLTVNEDTTGQVNVLTGVTDADHDTVHFGSAGTPAHGTLACTAAGLCGYTPALNYYGADAFTFAVDDGHGGTATGTAHVTVTPVNDLPTAAFTASPASGTEPLVVAFDAGASFDVEGIHSFGWAFGDGATGTGVTATHTYAHAGTYQVTLTVTDTSNATVTANATVVVSPAAPPARDSVGLERSGDASYRLGGMLDSGNFVLTYAKGTVQRIDGTGVIGDRQVDFDLRVSSGVAHGKITLSDARGKTLDKVRVRGTRITIAGHTVSGVSQWGTNPAALNSLVWAVTDAPAATG